MPELPEFADLIQNRYNRESGAVNPVMPGRVRNSGKLALSYNLYCFGGCEALPVGSDEEKGGGAGRGVKDRAPFRSIRPRTRMPGWNPGKPRISQYSRRMQACRRRRNNAAI